EGAIRLAKLVRSDLSNATPLGTPMLTGAAPDPHTTIAGQTFAWAQGLILNYSFATGQRLITGYQRIYGTGVLISDGVFVSDGVLISDGVFVSDGVLISDSIF